MLKAKKSTGKGHTFYDFDLPKTEADYWILIAESCYEIATTLLEENSYAATITLYLCGYDSSSESAACSFDTGGLPRYPAELFRLIEDQAQAHSAIALLLHSARRLMLRVECRPYVVPLFGESSTDESAFQLLESIRDKVGSKDAIGHGFEGLRYGRIKTYTPKRQREMARAIGLLRLKPQLYRWFSESQKKSPP